MHMIPSFKATFQVMPRLFRVSLFQLCAGWATCLLCTYGGSILAHRYIVLAIVCWDVLIGSGARTKRGIIVQRVCARGIRMVPKLPLRSPSSLPRLVITSSVFAPTFKKPSSCLIW